MMSVTWLFSSSRNLLKGTQNFQKNKNFSVTWNCRYILGLRRREIVVIRFLYRFDATFFPSVNESEEILEETIVVHRSFAFRPFMLISSNKVIVGIYSTLPLDSDVYAQVQQIPLGRFTSNLECIQNSYPIIFNNFYSNSHQNGIHPLILNQFALHITYSITVCLPFTYWKTTYVCVAHSKLNWTISPY